MARRTTNGPEPSPLPHLTLPRVELDRQLGERIARGRELQERAIASEADLKAARSDFYTWHEYNSTLLQRSFSTSGPEKVYSRQLRAIYSVDQTQAERLTDFRDDVEARVRLLESLQERLGLYEDVTETPAPRVSRPKAATRTTIFIVHGRSHAPKESVARFLEQVSDLQPTILHEQPNSGRTIIEKFEDHAADSAFAVVLLTGDDEGGLLGSGDRQRRARQNVVFELGFFIGTLGRGQVAVLYEADVELPSDMSGVLYTPLDPSGAWRLELAREMRAAGIEVDLNRL